MQAFLSGPSALLRLSIGSEDEVDLASFLSNKSRSTTLLDQGSIKILLQAFYMPIKLPKGFQRRKSSGNALEELPNPPEPSFRVFERPHDRKSFDGGNTFNNYKRMSLARPLSEGQFGDDQLFADGRTRKPPLNRYVVVFQYA